MASNLSNLWPKEYATLTWILENFTSDEQFTSLRFGPPNNDRDKFQLLIHPNWEIFDVYHVAVALHYIGEAKELPIHYRISIVNQDSDKLYTKEFYWNYAESIDSHSNYNICNFITRQNCNSFVIGHSLNIYCELNVLDQAYDKIEIFNDFQSLLNSENLSDFALSIGEKDFKVHKSILASRSAVFAAMFDHEETKESQENRVELIDMSVEVCEQMLSYIYTGKIPPMNDFAQDLFVAADKYQLEHLKEICEQALCTSLSPETVVDLLQFADLHRATNLKSKCIEYISNNSVKVRETESWKAMISSSPELMVELYLDISDRSKAFFK